MFDTHVAVVGALDLVGDIFISSETLRTDAP